MVRLPARYAMLMVALLLGIGVTATPLRADKVVTKKVQFKRGASSATQSGSVKGYDTVRYEVAAIAGQKMTVKLVSKSTSVYFNVLSKKTKYALETEPAPREVTSWSGTLPETDTYIVEVYLVRAVARRGSKANFSISISANNAK